MKKNQLAIVLALVGAAALWYVSRRSNMGTAANPFATAQNPAPVLPSRQIGSGYIDAITGGTGMAPISVNPYTGDATAPLGTDLILPAVDPLDPSLYGVPTWDVQVPDLESGASSGIDFTTLFD